MPKEAAAPSPGCVYCLGNGSLAPRQVLLRGEQVYVGAPLGQMVEGFLCIAPYRCVPSLALLGAPALDEVRRLRNTLRDFLTAAPGCTQVLCYEQGRGGDGTRHDPSSGFPLHAHLCLLPIVSPLVPDLPTRLLAHLRQHFSVLPLDGLQDLPTASQGQPYLYLEAPDAMLLQGRNDTERRALACARLKPLLADLGGVPGRGDWRNWPGHDALDRLINRWNQPWPRTSLS